MDVLIVILCSTQYKLGQIQNYNLYLLFLSDSYYESHKIDRRRTGGAENALLVIYKLIILIKLHCM